jgi:hypothetical protein
MRGFEKIAAAATAAILLAGAFSAGRAAPNTPGTETRFQIRTGAVTVHRAMKFDVSQPLASLRVREAAPAPRPCARPDCGLSPAGSNVGQAPAQPAPVISAAGAAVEQTSEGRRPPVPLVDSFDGLGAGFTGPQGTAQFRNPSDNSLAVGPDDIVQIVNARFAVYTKKGRRYDETGKVLYGPVPTNEIFHGFGGACAARDNGDAVVRYDQLARRWLIVMPVFRPILPGENRKSGAPSRHKSAATGQPALPGHPSIPGPPAAPRANPPKVEGTYAMCYAVSVGADPLGAYYRYAFERNNFPDYPRPAVWPDGYYVATSSGDTVIQKQDCIADRKAMLKGKPATEQCVVIDGVNFLNNADIDGHNPPPAGAPNILMAAGGTQLKKIFDSAGIYYWKVHVDWKTPANTKATGPIDIPVAPYHYLCDGQLTDCVPQPGTGERLDAQGDKLMQRLVYRRIGDVQSIVAAQSVDTHAGGGGVRWYEFRLDKLGDVSLYQQGTYAPDRFYRWMPSIDMDRMGDIGVGYSFGGTPNFAGQRFAARKAGDPKGELTFHETVLAQGEAAQTNTLRWEDYTTTAMDPSDGCTFWYVGDYLKKDATSYSTKIGAFRVPGCKSRK